MVSFPDSHLLFQRNVVTCGMLWIAVFLRHHVSVAVQLDCTGKVNDTDVKVLVLNMSDTISFGDTVETLTLSISEDDGGNQSTTAIIVIVLLAVIIIGGVFVLLLLRWCRR